MSSNSSASNDTVIEVTTVVRKADDLETHVRKVSINGLHVIELRDYVPSLREYGRGYWIPGEPALVKALSAAIALLAKDA